MPTNSTRTPGAMRSRRGGRAAAIIRPMAQWLVKEEPDHYGYAQLERDRKTVWAGVRNPLAQKHLLSVRRGDRIFYYHPAKQKSVLAPAKAATDAYPDPTDAAGKMFVVEIVPERSLSRPCTL